MKFISVRSFAILLFIALIWALAEFPMQKKDLPQLALFAIWAIAVFAYMTPTLIANSRNHRNRKSILVLNLFLGWTFIGWVVALIWAYSDNTAMIPKPE